MELNKKWLKNHRKPVFKPSDSVFLTKVRNYIIMIDFFQQDNQNSSQMNPFMMNCTAPFGLSGLQLCKILY